MIDYTVTYYEHIGNGEYINVFTDTIPYLDDKEVVTDSRRLLSNQDYMIVTRKNETEPFLIVNNHFRVFNKVTINKIILRLRK